MFRSAECDIRIKNTSTSRFHAKIRLDENFDCTLENLSTTNATTINDTEFTATVPLKDGDRINIAERIFVFRKGKMYRIFIHDDVCYQIINHSCS